MAVAAAVAVAAAGSFEALSEGTPGEEGLLACPVEVLLMTTVVYLAEAFLVVGVVVDSEELAVEV